MYRCVAAGVLVSAYSALFCSYILVADVFADAAVPTVGGILAAAGVIFADGAFAADAASAVADILDAAGIHAVAHFLTAASLVVADITKILI